MRRPIPRRPWHASTNRRGHDGFNRAFACATACTPTSTRLSIQSVDCSGGLKPRKQIARRSMLFTAARCTRESMASPVSYTAAWIRDCEYPSSAKKALASKCNRSPRGARRGIPTRPAKTTSPWRRSNNGSGPATARARKTICTSTDAADCDGDDNSSGWYHHDDVRQRRRLLCRRRRRHAAERVAGRRGIVVIQVIQQQQQRRHVPTSWPAMCSMRTCVRGKGVCRTPPPPTHGPMPMSRRLLGRRIHAAQQQQQQQHDRIHQGLMRCPHERRRIPAMTYPRQSSC